MARRTAPGVPRQGSLAELIAFRRPLGDEVVPTSRRERDSRFRRRRRAGSSGGPGGPLVNLSGQVIGMNTAIATSSVSNTAENIGFAIPITAAMKVANHLTSS